MKTFLDRGEVEYIDTQLMGADLTVVNAARVSFAKRKEAIDASDVKLIDYLAHNDHWTPFGHVRLAFRVKGPLDEGYWWNLAEWATREDGAGFVLERERLGDVRIEGSLWGWLRGFPSLPEEAAQSIMHEVNRVAPISTTHLAQPWAVKLIESMTHDPAAAVRVPCKSVTLRIKAPIFVMRQFMRSNHGIVYNEVSRRYVDDPPEIHVPAVWRGRPEKGIKQGSGDPLSPSPQNEARLIYATSAHDSIGLRDVHPATWAYDMLLRNGVAPEQARIVLPLSTYTEVWATFTPSALERVLKLRSTDPSGRNHAQEEIRALADAIRAEVG